MGIALFKLTLEFKQNISNFDVSKQVNILFQAVKKQIYVSLTFEYRQIMGTRVCILE